MKKQRLIVIIVVILAIVGFFGYNYVYQDHRDIKSETSTLEITAPYLLERFKTNNAEELLNKTITVTGKISDVEENGMTLNESVYASFENLTSENKVGDKIKIKGRCIGYDELFDIVKLDQSTVVK